MLDNRIYTFLELCDTMNYHKTAIQLNMTQPAVTQHIKFLEELYGCKLFSYGNRKLLKTKAGVDLEKYARSIIALNLSVKEALLREEVVRLNIGATKTIGEYLLKPILPLLIVNKELELNLMIDNTENLLRRLNHFELDILMLEGYIDKEKYQSKRISEEELVGICALDHPFAHKEVNLEEVFTENVLLREIGSGTRAVFEHFLGENGYGVSSFHRKSILSSNKLIEQMVEEGIAISFVYDIIARDNPNIAQFKILGCKMHHEFNYVFIDELKSQWIMGLEAFKQLGEDVLL